MLNQTTANPIEIRIGILATRTEIDGVVSLDGSDLAVLLVHLGHAKVEAAIGSARRIHRLFVIMDFHDALANSLELALLGSPAAFELHPLCHK